MQVRGERSHLSARATTGDRHYRHMMRRHASSVVTGGNPVNLFFRRRISRSPGRRRSSRSLAAVVRLVAILSCPSGVLKFLYVSRA